MMIDFKVEEILPLLEGFDFTPDKEFVKRLNIYGNLLLEWNQKMNLTAITEPREVLYKHFYDCLLFLKHIKLPKNSKIIDVGTGAGFPGMVLKIARPDLELTLMDSLNKRLIFLNEVLKATSLSAEVVHSRAEDGGRNPLYREKYDFATARAVAGLAALSEYCLPFVKKGGYFAALKGASGEEELKEAQNALKLLGGDGGEVIKYNLREDEQRTVIMVKKISQTSPKYPRSSVKITKNAL